jgi:hypothetical protein
MRNPCESIMQLFAGCTNVRYPHISQVLGQGKFAVDVTIDGRV